MQNELINTNGEMVLGEKEASRERRPPRASAAEVNTGWEVVVGRIVALTDSAEILVELSRDGSELMKARTVVSVSEKEIGEKAVLAFEEGDPAKPIILGLIIKPGKVRRKVSFTADGDKFVVVAESEIELRCGDASITLTRAGKVLIKGEYVSTRAKGMNRIKGASVSIN